jgi:putative flippase GtrA
MATSAVSRDAAEMGLATSGEQSGIRTFAKFVLVGGTGQGLIMVVTYALVSVVQMWYFLSFILASVVGWTFVFFANARFAFVTNKLSAKSYIIFLGGYVLLFCLNSGIVYGLTSGLNVFYEVSIVIGALVTVVPTFLFNRFLVFAAAHA